MENNGIKIEDQNYAVILHLSLLLGIVIPFLGYFAAFMLWVLKRNGSTFVNEQGKEAINFMLNILILGTAIGILCITLIGFILMLPLVALAFIFPVIAAVKVSKGRNYKYPFIYRFIK